MSQKFTLRSALFSSASIAILLSACHGLPPAGTAASKSPAPVIPDKPRLLLSSQPLQLARDCVSTQSVAIDFVIDGNGHTSNIEIPPAPACLQQALRDWVSSFKYVPRATAESSSVEWLLVTAPRG